MTNDEPGTVVATVRAEQSEALYPHLLAGPWERSGGVLYQRMRTGSGLHTIAVRHDALSEAQFQALSEFRLQQYLLCGYYDPAVISAQGLRTDPALNALPPGTIHVLVGTPDGRLLAYFFMQPAVIPSDAPDRQPQLRRIAQTLQEGTTLYMGDADRPLFPSEFDTFSPEVYTSLPALSRLPVEQVRELARLLRNQAHSSPLGAAAAIEAIYAISHLTIHGGDAIQALIGNMSIYARRLMMRLNIPTIYAPLVPVLVDRPDYYWIPGMNITGEFWPFVISIEDARTDVWYFNALDEALGLEPAAIAPAFIELHERAQIVKPKALVPDAATCPILWTPDPLYGASNRHISREGSAPRAEDGERRQSS
ncbi:MAG: hypothetical protein IVW57_12310 [Ktedonobacterales bacterium]|nr:hypothetical protein [Ktedonobacterales bacterium]